MYTLHNAARVLGVSESTVRKWIKQDNIEITYIETNRKRLYLSYKDVLALADKHKPLKVNRTELGVSYQETTGLYTVLDVARILGVSYRLVRRWIADSGLEKKIIETDRKRIYLSYADIVDLARRYNRSVGKLPGKEDETQEDSHTEENRLYTVADAALFLGVTTDTLRDWLLRYNIEKRTLETDRRRVYIAYSDIMLLASKQSRKRSVYPVDTAANIREMRGRLERIEAGIVNLEKYIKRSIYLGK
jgi:predicted site-specific integrase-resolvase